MLLELSGKGSNAPSVSSTFIPDEPFRTETAASIVKQANDTLMVDLVAKEEELQVQYSQNPSDTLLANQLRQIQEAKTALENGNIAPGVALVGSEVIGPFLENEPRLKSNTGLLGPWKSAADAYLNPDQTQEAMAPRKEYVTAEEVQADIDAGLLREGDVVIINGQEVPIQFGD
jgi:hypothetical protein